MVLGSAVRLLRRSLTETQNITIEVNHKGTDMSVDFADELIENPIGVSLLAELEAMQRPDVLPREIQRAAQDLINLVVRR